MVRVRIIDTTVLSNYLIVSDNEEPGLMITFTLLSQYACTVTSAISVIDITWSQLSADASGSIFKMLQSSLFLQQNNPNPSIVNYVYDVWYHIKP